MIQSNFIDMEKMLALLEQVQTVQDAPNAKELVVSQGHVVFGKHLLDKNNKKSNMTYLFFGRQCHILL
jgi:ABC-type transport system involved in Fe-S cluster assembly fused permease/ATPase subunit